MGELPLCGAIKQMRYPSGSFKKKKEFLTTFAAAKSIEAREKKDPDRVSGVPGLWVYLLRYPFGFTFTVFLVDRFFPSEKKLPLSITISALPKMELKFS